MTPANRLGTRVALFAASFLLFAGLAGVLAWRVPELPDLDSYYHLAVAREYKHAPGLATFPWARFSLMRDGFGDKELLFHWLLVPFVGEGTSTAGGRLALALLAALSLALIGYLSWVAIGRPGLLAPFAVALLSLDATSRLARLRPELLALPLLLLAAWAAAARRPRWLAPIGALFALSYTAFHLLLGLAALWWLDRWRRERHLDWAVPLYTTLGVTGGLVAHPQFPANLAIWAAQNIAFFRWRGVLDVGAEILPAPASVVLGANFGWFLLAVAVWAARSPVGPREPERGRLDAGPFVVAAALFGVMYLAMWRFGVYFYCFATVAIAWSLAARGCTVGARLPLPGGRSAPLGALAAAITLVGSLAALAAAAETLAGGGPRSGREADWAAFGRAMPPGARVAAHWGYAEVFFFFAPQARYLAMLDPVFTALPYPDKLAAHEALFDGSEPDPVFLTAAILESDHLALQREGTAPALLARLAEDPRIVALHDGRSGLFRLTPGRNEAFRLDWRTAPASPEELGDAGSDSGPPATVAYPRPEDPALRGLEGYVDARRVLFDGGCARFESGEPGWLGRRRFEFSPAGPGTLWLNGQPLVRLGRVSGAVLGQGARVEVEGSGQEATWRVVVCPDPATGHQGFYLRALAMPSADGAGPGR